VGISTDPAALVDIKKWARATVRNGEKIGRRAERIKKRLAKNLAVLEKHMASIGVEAAETGAPDTA